MHSISILGLLWSVTVLCSALELTSPDWLSIAGGCPRERYGELLKDPTYEEYFEKFKKNCSYELVLDQCACSSICPQAPKKPCGGSYHMYGMCVKENVLNNKQKPTITAPHLIFSAMNDRTIETSLECVCVSVAPHASTHVCTHYMD